ncbi:MAG: class I SAM-dependent methyltransferase [Promethearchaeota archaeon]
MKEIDNVTYFNINDISDMFHKKISANEIRGYFEEGKIKGKKIENKWHATQDAIDNFMKVLSEERAVMVGPQEIDLSNLGLKGRILDIGGGGEGIIGQVKGEQVIAIDHSKRELEEAPDTGELKIIMDAKDLQFLDNTFNTVSVFFTMMYIPIADHKKIFEEIYRVLKENGEFMLWDLIIPRKGKEKRDIYGIYLKVKIYDKIIDSGYGVLWDKEQDMKHYLDLAKEVGFEIIKKKEEKDHFFARFRKVESVKS